MDLGKVLPSREVHSWLNYGRRETTVYKSIAERVPSGLLRSSPARRCKDQLQGRKD